MSCSCRYLKHIKIIITPIFSDETHTSHSLHDQVLQNQLHHVCVNLSTDIFTFYTQTSAQQPATYQTLETVVFEIVLVSLSWTWSLSRLSTQTLTQAHLPRTACVSVRQWDGTAEEQLSLRGTCLSTQTHVQTAICMYISDACYPACTMHLKNCTAHVGDNKSQV